MAENYVVDELAGFVVGAQWADLTGRPLALMKRNVLDSIACAVGSLGGQLVAPIREHTAQFSGAPTATLVGGGRAPVDQAAFFNAVLVRYPDLLDTYLTVGGLCHPADNFGAVLAVAEHTGASGPTSCWRWPSPTRCSAGSAPRCLSWRAGSITRCSCRCRWRQAQRSCSGSASNRPRTPSPPPRPTTCRWRRCTPSRSRTGRASHRPAPACAPCTRPCWPPAASPDPGRCSRARTDWCSSSIGPSISRPPTGG